MEKRKLPPKYVVYYPSGTDLLPLVAFSPLVIALAVFLGMWFTQSASLEEWTIPLLGIGIISLLGFVAGILFDAGLRLWHIRRIKQTYADQWAVWQKYKTDEQWQKFIEKEYEREVKESGVQWAPIIIVGVVVLIIGGMAVVNNYGTGIVFGLGGFMLVIIGIFAGGGLVNRVRARRRYQRRKRMPIPAIIISEHGVYDEDLGINSIRRLRSVDLQTSPKGQSTRINFLVGIHWLDYLLVDEQVRNNQWLFTLLVPKGYEDEAYALVQRFQIEVLI